MPKQTAPSGKRGRSNGPELSQSDRAAQWGQRGQQPFDQPEQSDPPGQPDRPDKKVALYIRVSTDAQAEEGYSIGAQTEKLTAFCTLKGWDNYELFIDGGYSGSNLERPEIQRLIQQAKSREIGRVVVYKLDRLSRSQKDTLYLIEDVFLPNEVDFVSINENIDTSTPYGRAMIGILSAFAQLERENIFLRTRMGMVERVKNGLWMGGGRVPFGYDYNKELGIIVPNADALKVKRIYELYLQGYSPQRIARMLDLKYDKLVTQILKRKSNTGVIVYKGVEYEGLHQPIVSKEIYQRAMQKMKERSRTRATKAHHLLTGLCYCGVCGARMRYQKWGEKGYKLICYSRDKSKPHMVMDPDCANPPVWAEEIEEIVLKDLFRLSANISAEDWDKDQEAVDPIAMLEQQIQRITAKIKRLYHLYAEEGNHLLLETIRENEAELAAVRQELETERQHHAMELNWQDIRERAFEIEATWPYMTPRERQQIIRDCVRKIVITDGHLDIYYTFINNQQQKQEQPAAQSA